MKEKIIEVLERFQSEVDNFNDAVFASDYKQVAEEIDKLYKK
jgi:Mg2+ and Co2+ transporter CorA